MKISPILPLSGPHGTINRSPRYAGCGTFYRDALFSTLVELKPTVCLEIGTNTGHTARVFQRYFEEYGLDESLLITADVKIYVEMNHPNVEQVQVHPHVNNIKDLHIVEDSDLIGGRVDQLESVDKNISIIKDVMRERGISEIDFAFIDGDHQRESMLKDIKIARSLIKDSGYILLDDIHDYVHESAKTFHDEIKLNDQYDCYEFEDWEDLLTGTGTAGTALIWQR
jgi:cephalosporin hydroxylase